MSRLIENINDMSWQCSALKVHVVTASHNNSIYGIKNLIYGLKKALRLKQLL